MRYVESHKRDTWYKFRVWPNSTIYIASEVFTRFLINPGARQWQFGVSKITLVAFIGFQSYIYIYIYIYITLRPRQNGPHFPDDILKCIFLNENVWIPIKISLKFVLQGPINNISALVQIMAWRRSGDKPLSEPMMISLLTHICVTRPQWYIYIYIYIYICRYLYIVRVKILDVIEYQHYTSLDMCMMVHHVTIFKAFKDAMLRPMHEDTWYKSCS